MFVHDEPEAWVFVRYDGNHHVKVHSLQSTHIQRTPGSARIRRGMWTFAGPIRR